MQLTGRLIKRVQASFSHVSGASVGISTRLVRPEPCTTVLPCDLSSMVASDFLRDGSENHEPEFLRRSRSPKAFLSQAGKSPSVTSIIIYWLKQSPTCPDSKGEAVKLTSRREGLQKICGHILELPQCSPLLSSCLHGEKHSHRDLARRPTECAGSSCLVFEDKGNHMFWGQ